jgi:hypothetical protein
MVVFEVKMRPDQDGSVPITKLRQAHVTEPHIGPLSALFQLDSVPSIHHSASRSSLPQASSVWKKTQLSAHD